MVGGQDDNGLVGNTCDFQLLHQIGHGCFQLQIAGDIGLNALGVVGIGRLCHITVLLGHVVAAPVVVAVAADRHIVSVKVGTVFHILLDVAVHRRLHHIQIGLRPQASVGQFQTIAHTIVIIAQIGMGLIPAVIGIAVVVVGQRTVSQFLEHPAQANGHIVVRADLEGVGALDPVGDQTGHDGELAAGGGQSPVGLIEISEHKAVVGQLVQSGSQLLADDVGREGLRRDQDQILPRKIVGVFVLLGGSQAVHILMDALQSIILLALRQTGKINVQHVVAVHDGAGSRLRTFRGIHRGRGIHTGLVRGAGGGLRRGGNHRLVRPGRSVRFIGINVNGGQRHLRSTEDSVLQLQAHTADDTELRDGKVGGEIVGIEVPGSAKVGHQGTGQLEQHHQNDHGDTQGECLSALFKDPLAQEDHRQQRDERKQNKGNAGHDHFHQQAKKVTNHLPDHFLHIADAEVGLKEALAAVLHAGDHGAKGHHADGQTTAPLPPGQQVQHNVKQQACRHGEEQDAQQRGGEEGGLRVEDAQQQLQIEHTRRDHHRRLKLKSSAPPARMPRHGAS